MKTTLRRDRGFSLIEVLVAIGISSVVLMGTFKVLNIASESSQMAKTAVVEQELNAALNRVLGEGRSCRRNLIPGSDTNISETTGTTPKDGTDPTKNIAALKVGSEPVVEQGELFNDRLEIVNIALDGDKNPMNNLVTRHLTVYYKKPGLGNLETLGGKDSKCESGDFKGCYFTQCQVNYKLGKDENGKTVVTRCDALNCLSLGMGDFSPECYHVDWQDMDDTILTKDLKDVKEGETGGRTLVGCGGNSDIERSATTAFGYGAGAGTTGWQNTFMGYKAGYNNVEGNKNTFIGFKAGYEQTKGDNNIYIGNEVGPDKNKVVSGITKDGSNQLNIGNLILGRLPASQGGGDPEEAKIPGEGQPGLVIRGSLKVVSLGEEFKGPSDPSNPHSLDPGSDPFKVLEVCDKSGTCKRVCLENGVGCPN